MTRRIDPMADSQAANSGSLRVSDRAVSASTAKASRWWFTSALSTSWR